ncbi:hypothetical protein H0H81_004375 [Sphagnurus paluster]|uniref:Uncharacterized protein n=1 Tax=Sphagnurus paluster TaxID=117069 RepID=A0A9P7GF04_9AGAR|nr:hypothetical protein H0H81_004375 [Sphagnurus paluster]
MATTQTPSATKPLRHRRRKGLTATVMFYENEPLPPTPPESHHHISPSCNFPVHIQTFILANDGDPAVQDFYTKLQDHLLGRVLHPNWSGGPNKFSETECANILILNDRFYRHKVMRVNYTSYDVWRGQDSINSRNHADIMTLAPEDDPSSHPF